jgi:hypothetical protein
MSRFWILVGLPFRVILALILALALLVVDCFCIPLSIIFFGEPSSLATLAIPDLYRWVFLTGGFE